MMGGRMEQGQQPSLIQERNYQIINLFMWFTLGKFYYPFAIWNDNKNVQLVQKAIIIRIWQGFSNSNLIYYHI